jgi:hypothetical protein
MGTPDLRFGEEANQGLRLLLPVRERGKTERLMDFQNTCAKGVKVGRRSRFS